MKRSQPETSGTPPAKKQALTKMIPPVNIGAVSTEVGIMKLKINATVSLITHGQEFVYPLCITDVITLLKISCSSSKLQK